MCKEKKVTKNRQTKGEKKRETSPHLVGCVCKKAVLPEGSAVSLQDRDDRRLKAVERLFCGLVGRSKVKVWISLIGKVLRESTVGGEVSTQRWRPSGEFFQWQLSKGQIKMLGKFCQNHACKAC